jgi:hypothetical protein
MPLIPKYPFIKRSRIADAFFGPNAESTDREKSLAQRIQIISDMAALCKLREASCHRKPFKWNKVKRTADDTIPHQDIEETKTTESLLSSPPLPFSPSSPSSLSSAPVSPRPSQDQCPFCFFKNRFHRSTATGIMRELTRFGATCSESILTRRHATTTAFEAFISLTPTPPRSRNQSFVRSLFIVGWSYKVKIIIRVIRLKYIRGLSKAISL